MNHSTCPYCARTKRLDAHGLVVVHYLMIPVSAKAIKTVGAGRVRRRCQGGGRPPREVTR
jgi:glutaredoxin